MNFFRKTFRPEIVPLAGAVTVGVTYGVMLTKHNLTNNGDVVTKFSSNRLVRYDENRNHQHNTNVRSPRFVRQGSHDKDL